MTDSVEEVQVPAISQPNALANPHETAATAVAAKAKALVEARYLVAINRPRDMDQVRVRLLGNCKRPGFADVALYLKPVGGGQKAEGLSIRFAEAMIQAVGNIDVDTPVVYEDGQKRIVRVTVTDLETNATYSTDLSIAKTVERRKLKKGQVALETRENSYGQMVYIVEATEDELQIKTAALVSKAIRNNGLRLLPGDIKDECIAKIKATLRNRDAEDPDAAKKRMIDAFDGKGIKPQQLKAYIGHDLDTLSEAEIEELRGIFTAVSDGETTWQAVMDLKIEAGGGTTNGGRAAAAKKAVEEQS